MPELILKIYELVKAGDMATAKQIQYDVDNIIYALCATKGNMYASIKEVLRRREGLDLGGVREPLYNLVPEDMPQIEKCAVMIDEAMAKWIK